MIKRKPRRNRPVVDWPKVKAIVIERDLHQMWRQSEDAIHHHVSEHEFRAMRPIVCIAPIVDVAVSRKDCWGRTTLDHVKPEPRAGVKADDAPEQLVSVCQGHSEDGMKAGHQWNTAHRAEERDYLRKVYAHQWERIPGTVVLHRCLVCGWGWKIDADNDFPCPGVMVTPWPSQVS